MSRGNHLGDDRTNARHLVSQIDPSHFALQIDTFAILKIGIRNRSRESLRLLLRLQPAIRNQPHAIALDLAKRFCWSGALQQAIHPVLEPGALSERELGVVILYEGDYEIGASVEEIVRLPPQQTSTPDESALLRTERRIWHARQPCWIDAVSDIER